MATLVPSSTLTSILLRRDVGRLCGAEEAGSVTVPAPRPGADPRLVETLGRPFPDRRPGADPRLVEMLGRPFPDRRERCFVPFFFLAVFPPEAAFAAMRRISTSDPLT